MNLKRKRRTQAERTASSDKAMFKAAIKLIAKDGPTTMTLAKVGKAAGFSGGLVSYRFGSKSKLLQATAARILELWREHVIRPAHADEYTIESLKLSAKLYFEAAKSKSDLMMAQYRLMNVSYSSYKEVQPAFESFDRQMRSDIVNAIEMSKQRGEVRKDVDPEAFAVQFIAILRGTALQYFISPSDVDLDKAYEQLMTTFDVLLGKS